MGTAPHVHQVVDHLCKCLLTYLLTKEILLMKTDKIYEILAGAPDNGWHIGWNELRLETCPNLIVWLMTHLS